MFWILLALAGWVFAGIGWYRVRETIKVRRIADGLLKDWIRFLATVIEEMGGTLRISKATMIRLPLTGAIEQYEDLTTGDMIYRLVGPKRCPQKEREDDI